jgi:hypothetical protein
VPSDHKLIGTELQIGDLFRAYWLGILTK